MSTSPSTPADLAAADSALRTAQDVVDSAIARLTEAGIDDNQVLAYDTAHAAAAVMAARGLLEYGETGENEAAITCAFAADEIADLAS